MELSFEQFIGLYYQAIDDLSAGKVDHADIQHTWENGDGVVEGVSISMARDVEGRHNTQQVDEYMAKLIERKDE